MPRASSGGESAVMRYRPAVVLAASVALAIPVAATAESRVLDLVTPGTASDVFFRAASTDGSHVFVETASALVPEDGDSSTDIYDFGGGSPVLLSDRIQPGVDGALDVGFGGASADGSRVFFSTREPLVEQDDDDDLAD